MQRSVCVFCGSSYGRLPVYREVAGELGRVLANAGITTVYGGAHVGLMGVVADAALAAGGAVTGVIPEALAGREIAHTGLTELYIVGSMHERKARMAERAAAFVALPGGFGTLDEFCEVLTWAQLGIHASPCVLLNVEGYYDALLRFMDHATDEGFLRPENRALIEVVGDAREAVAWIQERWTQHAHLFAP